MTQEFQLRIRALIVISLLVLFGAPDSLCAVLCGNGTEAAAQRTGTHARAAGACHDADAAGSPFEFSDDSALDCAIACPHCNEPRAFKASLTANTAKSPSPLLMQALPAPAPRTRDPLPALNVANTAHGFSGHQIVIRKSSLLL